MSDGNERLQQVAQWIAKERTSRLSGATFGMAGGLFLSGFIGFMSAARVYGLNNFITMPFNLLFTRIIILQTIIGLVVVLWRELRKRRLIDQYEGRLMNEIQGGSWMAFTGLATLFYFLWELRLYFWLNDENQWRAAEIILMLSQTPDRKLPLGDFAIGGMSDAEKKEFIWTLGYYGLTRMRGGIVRIRRVPSFLVNSKRQ